DSEIPVISAVGHEPDFTIADFVADVRAATPSNAAEIAVPDISEIVYALNSASTRLGQSVNRELKMCRQRLGELSAKRAMQHPRNFIDDKRLLLDHSQERLAAGLQRKVYISKERYVRLGAALDAMSPLKVLGRGYAIARREDGSIVKVGKDVKPGDKITLRLRKDEIDCVVT
ncbi:MAG: exodeoxyribonuclease VII large subunit, partial [Oscillospiraceae bacterium]|nr:exodeoxyribonuclease VII large subunit [Oscillospiraceae bacterium]